MKNDTLLECGSENSATIITCVAGSGEAESSNPSLLLSRQEFHRKVMETQTRLRGYALFLCGSHPAAEELLQETTLATGEKTTIRRFVRYQLGEGIEKKQSDLAAEIAEMTAKKA